MAQQQPAEINLRIGGSSAPPVDYDALARQAGGTPDYDALAQAAGGTPESRPRAMSFGMGPGTPEVLERTRRAPAPDRGVLTQLGELVREATMSVNIPAIGAAAHQLVTDPLGTISQIGEGQGKLLYDAIGAYEKGDYPKATARFVEYLLPLIGPRMAQSSEELEAGNWGKGIGAAIDVGAQLVQPKLVQQVTPIANRAIDRTVAAANRIRPFANPNEATNAAVEAARRAGVRVDAGTATGNRFIQGTQALAEKATLPGAAVGEAERYLRERGMTQWGERLADDVGLQGAPPGTKLAPTSKTAAAEATRTELAQGVTEYNTEATTNYDRFRAIEDQAEFTEQVRTHPAGSRAERALLDKLEANAPDKLAPTFHELGVMRQIEIELREQPRTNYMLQEERYGGALEHVEGTGGAGSQVFHDLIRYAPEGQAPTGSRVDMAEGIRHTLETGRWNQSSLAAREVARRRLRAQQASGGELPGPRLPPDAPLIGSMEQVQLPVDLGSFRQQMDGTYDFLLRKKELGPLYGDERVALEALDRLFTGPQFERTSIVDSVLGDLKTLARDPSGQITALRTKGQGVAAQAVQELEQAVQAAVARAGPEAQGALAIGREATKRKYQVRKALEGIDKSIKNPQLDFNPADAYEALVKDADHSVPLLRRIQKEAPRRIPELGRATLQGLLEKATAEGGFSRGAGLWNAWEKIGTDTRQILFGAHATEIDNFMLLAKRFSENINPPNTASVGAIGAQAGSLAASGFAGILPALLVQGAGGIFTKLLFSPKFARLITQGLRITAPRAHAPAAAQAAALAQITRAMREAGLELAPPVRLPAAAEQDQERSGR